MSDEVWRVCTVVLLYKEMETLVWRMTNVKEKSVPFISLAVKLRPARVGSSSTYELENFRGHVVCGLPFQQELGYACHVNGFFDIDSNRTCINLNSSVTGANAVRVQWNQELLRQVGTQAYRLLVLDLSKTDVV